MLPALGVASSKDGVLIIIDIQDRLAAVMERREEVVATTGLLIRSAAIVGMPIVVTRQYPQGLGDTHAAITTVLDEVIDQGATVQVVDKMSFDCMAEPGFVEAVCATGRKQLFVAGMETHICVTQTALSGLKEGFDVHLVADACCSRRPYSHDTAVARLAAAGASVTLAESVAYELVGRAGTPEFKQLLAAVKLADAARC